MALKTKFDFMKFKMTALLISASVIVVGLLFIVMQKGLDYNIEFNGGYLMQAGFYEKVNISDIRNAFSAGDFAGIEIQEFSDQNTEKFGTEVVLKVETAQQDIKTLEKNITEVLNTKFGKDKYEVRQSTSIGPKVGDELKSSTIQAIFWTVLLILLYIAIIRRISDYGITENRYFVFALALWLTGITLYLLFSKNKNIKLIPLTLCIITFAGSFGPWGAFSVSEKSQLGRFEKLLKENNLLVNGKISKTEKELPFKTRQAISSVVEYLTEYRNYNILQPYYKQNLDSLFPDTAYKSKPQELLSIMGVSYVSRWEREENYNEHFYFSTNRDNKYNIIKIDTFQYMISFNEYYNDYYKDSLFSNKYSGENIKAVITKKAKENFFRICFNDTVCEDIRLDTIIDKLNKNPQSYTYNIETKEMTLIKNTENISIKFVFSNIGGIKKNDSIIINTMGGDLFFNLREKK